MYVRAIVIKCLSMCGKYTTIIIIGRRGLNIKVLWNTQNRPTTTMFELFGSHRTEASVFDKFSSVRSWMQFFLQIKSGSKISKFTLPTTKRYYYLCIDSNLTFLSWLDIRSYKHLGLAVDKIKVEYACVCKVILCR